MLEAVSYEFSSLISFLKDTGMVSSRFCEVVFVKEWKRAPAVVTGLSSLLVAVSDYLDTERVALRPRLCS